MSFQTSALILSWVAILLLALVVSGLVRQVHALSTPDTRAGRPVGLPPGSPAPELHRLAPQHDDTLVLLFLEPECHTCAEVLDEATRHPAATVHAVYRGTAPGRSPVTVHQDAADLFDAYDAVATPYAVVVDRHGLIARTEPVGSRAALRALLDQTVVQPTPPEGTS